jgi:hypothetical protein
MLRQIRHYRILRRICRIGKPWESPLDWPQRQVEEYPRRCGGVQRNKAQDAGNPPMTGWLPSVRGFSCSHGPVS